MLAFGGVFLWRMTHPPRLPSAVVTGEAAIANEYTLADHTGRVVTAGSFGGRWQLVFFGFTHCPDVCPTTLACMAQVMDALGEDAAQVAPIFITVDPVRDRPEVMAAYVEAFHPRMVGPTGTQARTDAAAENFRAWYRAAPGPDRARRPYRVPFRPYLRHGARWAFRRCPAGGRHAAGNLCREPENPDEKPGQAS